MRAYHSVVNALELFLGYKKITKRELLALSIRHTINGHLPYRRFNEVGEKIGARFNESSVSSALEEWLRIDANTLGQIYYLIPTQESAVKIFNFYNENSDLGVQTKVTARESNSYSVERTILDPSGIDPMICQEFTHNFVDKILSKFRAVDKNKNVGYRPKQLSDVARAIGAESTPEYHLIRYFEAHPHASITEASKAMGCSEPILRKALQETGLTPTDIRLACRITKFIPGLAAGMSLPEISNFCGFSDISHMSKIIKNATGFGPKRFRDATLGK